MSKELNMLRPFFGDPLREFNVREVARLLKINPTTASNKLKGLKEKGLLKHRKERNLDLYRADMESSAYKDLKIYYTIRKMRESGLIDALNEFYVKPTIIIFGSASKGLDTATSDIDVVIVSEKRSEFPSEKEFSRKVGRQLQFFTVRHLRELKNGHLINSVLNGIVVEGELEWT